MEAVKAYTLSVYPSGAGAGDERAGLPAVKDAPDLLRQFGCGATWAAAYYPEFHRFDLGEAKRMPFDWNRRSTGILIGPDFGDEMSPRPLWLLRVKVNSRYNGYEIDTFSGQLSRFRGKSAAELDADTDALIQMDREIRKHPKPDTSANGSK